MGAAGIRDTRPPGAGPVILGVVVPDRALTVAFAPQVAFYLASPPADRSGLDAAVALPGPMVPRTAPSTGPPPSFLGRVARPCVACPGQPRPTAVSAYGSRALALAPASTARRLPRREGLPAGCTAGSGARPTSPPAHAPFPTTVRRRGAARQAPHDLRSPGLRATRNRVQPVPGHQRTLRHSTRTLWLRRCPFSFFLSPLRVQVTPQG